ncbi:MAG: hypothetical protein K0Q97_441 [Bacillota bacterium]|jgi:hypothetical protein|nr:hypothetical protein [Bacillota bacterium]
MDWDEIYTINKKPSTNDISEYINNPLWNELTEFIEKTYLINPQIEYSKCSAAHGWNVKYKKGSKSICTLYPNKNFYTCLVCVGSKEVVEIELLLPTFEKYIQELYRSSGSLNGTRWLMIDVTNSKILNDLKVLISIRVKINSDKL